MTKEIKVYEMIPGLLFQRGEFMAFPLDFKVTEMKRLGVRIIVNMYKYPDKELSKYMKAYFNLYMPDNKIPDPAGLLLHAKVIAKMMPAYPVLVHCHAGRNRSALMSALICMEHLHMTGKEAVEYVRSKRPNALANKHFVQFLNGLNSL